jgi:CDP-diacylglycerol--serine O-phosphatidyltransferase
MLAHLVDAANLITLGGMAISFFACLAVLLGRPSLAMALAAVAIVIDNVDGWMARRTVGRNPTLEHFGGHLDCYADFISKGIFPVLYLLTASDFQVVSIPVALIYLMAIAVRYSYEFVPDRDHIGLSPDYLIAFLCLLQLAAPQLGSAFVPTLMASLLGFAALAVASFPSPKLTGRAVVGFCLILVVLAAVLLIGDQGMSR